MMREKKLRTKISPSIIYHTNFAIVSDVDWNALVIL